jgi:hypothetical protein
MPNFLPIPPTNAVQDPQARAALDALAQNIKVAMDTFATKADLSTPSTSPAVGGASSFGTGGNGITNNILLGGGVFTQKNLIQDLANGTVSIVSGGLSSANVMKMGSNYILFQNSLANPLGSTGPYTGTVRTALGLVSTGIVGGYNDPSTGNWVSTLTIDTATGNLNVLGTIKANSIIQVGAYLGTDTVSTVLGNINTANSNASAALAATAAKLNKSSSDILSGTINLTGSGGIATGTISINGSGVASGSGVAITSKGIVGLSSGSPTFSIDSTTGAAIFKGDITGASGTFSGDITSSGHFTLSGTGFVYGGSSTQNTVAYINGTSSIYGLIVDGGGTFTTAILGNTSNGTGITGAATGIGAGVYAFSQGSGNALLAINSGTGNALLISGPFDHNYVHIATPPGSSGYFLAGDGNWYATGSLGGGTVNSVSGTGSVSGITLSGTVTTIGSLTLGGSLTLTSSQIYTGLSLGSTSGVLYWNGSAISAEQAITTFAGTNSGTATASAYTMNFVSSSSVSGLTLNTSGSGNTVTFTLSGAVSYATSAGSASTASYATSAGSVSSYSGPISQSQLIGSAPSSSYFLSGGGWTTVNVVSSMTAAGTGVQLHGDITFTTSVTGFAVVSSGQTITFVASSDESLKKNIKPIDKGLDFIRQLSPITFEWNTPEYAYTGTVYGFSGQNVLAASGGQESSLVYRQPKDGPLGGTLAVGADSIVAALTKAVQELDAKVTLLESKNA